MTVAENIKRIRKEKNLTQKQLGEKCGMSESTLRQYEIGYRNPKLETIVRIAAALEINSWNRELELLNHFRKLNFTGEHEAIKRVSELTELPRYTTPDPPQS